MVGYGGYGQFPPPSAGFLMLPKKRFRTCTDKNVHKVKFAGFEFKVLQVCQAYDPKRKYHSGFLLTPFSEKEIKNQSHTSGRGTLYIKGWDSNNGLWEITYPDARIRQLEEDLVWFHSDGTQTFKILTGNKASDIDDE
tara:strand:+ start:60 stop:473 length:414 start_codon:yes stop_codon:yes gene_type:complete